MARAIWSGALNFGLVTVPVELYSATEDHQIHFRQFERGTSDRIRYKRVNERTGKEVEYDDIVKGYELSRDDYVIVEPDELDAIAPGRSKTIDIENFVDLADVDAIYFQKSYWLAPAKAEFERAYNLLTRAMADTNKAAIATFVMRGKEYLAAVRSSGDALMLNTLHFQSDIRDAAKEIAKLPEQIETKPNELKMAVSLIESMTDEWEPAQYRDTYTERVERLVAEKREGHTVTAESAPDAPTKVVDLFEALSRSVTSRGRDTSTASGKGAATTGRSGRRGSSDENPEGKAPSDMTKAELDKMARKLQVKGRSKLSREELEEAVRSGLDSTDQQAS